MEPQIFLKRLRRFSLYLAMTACLALTGLKAQEINPSPYKTYLIIGAFTVENNAQRLVDLVKGLDMKATIRKNENRGLFYVYIDESPNRDEIKSRVLELRAKYTQFYDSWAYTGDFTDKPEPPKQNLLAKSDSNSSIEEVTKEMKEEAMEQVDKEDNQQFLKEPADAPEPFVKKENHYYLYFNTINSKNLKEVKGNVNIIDPERAKQLKQAKSHELVELEDPDNGTRRVKVATDMFGFREVQHTLDLDDVESLKSNPEVELIGDSIIVNFNLKRFKKGDVLVMYNVYFFKDAAIMKPESIYELNSLLDMLKENENLVVKIHGHTNGNSHGKIIHLDLEDKNFFGINGEHKESNGSAKKLSLFRSYTIQHWLMEQGIEESRMEIKGWGGKRMIYDKHSSQAEKNVRVEIEILEE